VAELLLFPAIRSADFERIRDRPDRVILYGSRIEDLDPVSVPSSARHVNVWTAWTWAFRRRWRVVELPEPLWLRALPLTMSVGIAVRLADLLRRRHTTVVTYAIENREGEHLFRGLPRSRQGLGFGFLRMLCAIVYDRIAFGSAASQRCYQDTRTLPRRAATSVHPDMWPECPKETDVAKDTTIAFVGALEVRKGVPFLLDAWTLSGLGARGWTLHIAGSGPLRESVESAAAADATLRYRGALGRSEVHALLAEAAILVLPSRPEGRWKEQIGHPINEGLAHGCQIVATPDTGLAHWLDEHGHLVLPSQFTASDLAEAICRAVGGERDPAVVRGSLPTAPGRARGEEWMYA
jgi:glycosyltransferase involved in cell wall biosynthesis